MSRGKEGKMDELKRHLIDEHGVDPDGLMFVGLHDPRQEPDPLAYLERQHQFKHQGSEQIDANDMTYRRLGL